MAYTGPKDDQSYAEYAGFRSEGREPGARRKMFKGYLKAANELRQSYFSQDVGQGTHHVEDGPGAFPDAAVVRSGNEEMILFPSYARRHVQNKRQVAATPGGPGGELTEEEFWRREWDKHEDSNAVVDVDVRGWIYTPPKGQHTRKQRMLIGLARQLSGIPAPGSNRPGDSGGSSAAESRASSPNRQQDEDRINLEAENIVRRGQQEQRYANRGAISERPGQNNDTDSLYGDRQDRGRSKSYASSIASVDSHTGQTVQKKPSWQPPEKMTSAELATANMHLLTRLKPFMANPLASTPISAFFYNESASRQQTVYTDTSGHFTLRAALDFVPTHVRVLAGEKLSATEEIIVTSPQGVSLISDIDDTIKHSAISAGVREIFRNAFIRELGDLTIEGVREWYTTLHDMGVKIHYVSNSPWQMYPALTSYFKLANLPKGSFHLKQYSGGMLQGIFEPVAERKRSSLDKIMRDFPDRKFVLVGDSGEADLEVYTETALANPGRVLGIFIRDVTSSVRTGYFDSNNSPGGSSRHSRNHSRHQSGDNLTMSKRLSRPSDIDDDAEMRAAIAASLEDMESEARRARRSINPDAYQLETARSTGRSASSRNVPRSPQRLNSSSHSPQTTNRGHVETSTEEEDLIDFSDPTPSKTWLEPPQPRTTSTNRMTNGNGIGKQPSPSPPPPPKPAGLKSPPPDAQSFSSSESAHKTPPARPRKPSSAVKPNSLPQIQTHQPSPLSQVTRQESTRKPPPPLPARRNIKGAIANALPVPNPTKLWQSEAPASQTRPRSSYTGRGSGSQSISPLTVDRSMTSPKSSEDLHLPNGSMNQAAPPPPPRRGIASYSTTAIRKQANRLSGSFDDDGQPGSPGDGISKKEYMWQQRWAKAKSALDRNGVTLRSWRTGSDVADVCIRLVEMELRSIEKESRTKKNDTQR